MIPLQRDPRFVELDELIAADKQLQAWRELDRLRAELAAADATTATKRGEKRVRWRMRRIAYLESKTTHARAVGR